MDTRQKQQSKAYEDAARLRKAIALTDALDAAGADPDCISAESWDLARRAAGVQAPSSRTRRLVRRQLRERLALRAAGADPFEGLT